MKKGWLAMLLALGMVVGVMALASTDAKADSGISLLYDDRKQLSELVGMEVESVEISEQVVTSKATGTDNLDSNVLVYEDGTLYAAGTGTATLTVNGTAYPVTVAPAPISLVMITGHSVGYGQEGNGAQSVVVEAGQAYSTHYTTTMQEPLTTAQGGLGYGAETRAFDALDAFAPNGGGTAGVDSALAYSWNRLTGEKIWVINAAYPGTCINEWQPGVAGHHSTRTYHYDTAVRIYQNAQRILANEVGAGHYTLSHMSILYFNGANFSNAGYTDWTYESLRTDYETMWNGFKTDLSADVDGDGLPETVESMGIVPFWSLTSTGYATDKAVGYYLAASEEYADVFTASDIYRDWLTEDGLAGFPEITYTTQSAPVAVPDAVKNINMDAVNGSENSVFCSADNTHLSQVTYNAVGMDIAENLNAYLNGDSTVTGLELYSSNGSKVADSIEMGIGATWLLVPEVEPGYGSGVSFEATGSISLQYPLQVVAESAGTGTLTASVNGETLYTLNVAVAAGHSHCVCGGHGEGVGNHSCESVSWTAWGDDESEKTSLPTAAGSYYLVSDVTLTSTKTIAEGVEVNLCLNGYNIESTARVYSTYGIWNLTDCGAEENWGTISTANSGTYGGITYIYNTTSAVNIYGGNLDANGTNMYGGVALIQNGTMNIYNGNLYGATCVRKYVTSSQVTRDGRGGVLYLMSGTCNIYGGDISGGQAQNAGGNIYAYNGTLNISGGTISGGKVDASLGTMTDGESAKGGNISVEVATVNITGGTITGGSSAEEAGNLYVGNTTTSTKAPSVTVSGGVISDGSAAKGGNIAVAAGKLLTVSAGEITGGTATGNGGSIYVYGTLTITGGTVTGGSSVSGHGGNINLDAGTLNMSGGTVTAGTANSSTSKQGGNINLGSGAACNITGGTVSNGVAGGYGGNICGTPGAVIKISQGSGKTTFITGGKVGNGTTGCGGNIFAGANSASSATLTISGGTVSAGQALKGGNVYADGICTVSGGTVSGGTVPSTSTSGLGGNFYVTARAAGGTLTITGGTVKGGTAYYGGNIYIHGVNDNSTVGNLVISGGLISNGNANCGGNIYTNGSVTMTKGTVENGKVTGSNACGGNVYIGMIRNTSNGEIYSGMTMSGGIIRDGYANGTGGNMQTHGSFTMTGGILSGGSAVSGGNVRVFRPGVFTLDGGTVEGGTARTGTGGVFQVLGYTPTTSYSSYGTLIIKSGTVSGGTAPNGGLIAVSHFGEVQIQGGVLEGGTATYAGGNIYMSGNTTDRPCKLTITGGTVSGGTAGTNGGNIYLVSSAKNVVYAQSGGVVSNGTAANGGNLYIDNSTGNSSLTVNITGGTFTGGTASGNGGNIYLNDRTILNLSDVTLTGGSADGLGDGIYICRTESIACVPTLNLSGNLRMDSNGTDLYIDNGNDTDEAYVNVHVDGLTGSDAAVFVDAAKKPGKLAACGEDLSDLFICTGSGYKVVWENDALYLTEDTETKVVALYDGSRWIADFSSFDEAVRVLKQEGTYLKLLADVDAGGYEVTGQLWIDLAGHDLSNLVISGTLYGMDSTTDSYSSENAGTLSCTLTGDGQVASNCKTGVDTLGSIKRYLAIPAADGSYGFHRFYIGITKISIAPASVGIGYKAVFAADDAVIAYLSDTNAFGYHIWVNADNVITRAYGAEKFVSLDEVTLRITNFMSTDLDQETNLQRANTPVYANAFIRLSDGTVITSSDVSYTFQDMMKMIDNKFEGFSENHKSLIQGLYQDFTGIMENWDIPNIHHSSDAWTKVDADGFLNLLTLDGGVYQVAAGSYELTEDVDLGSKTLKIVADTEVSICLNGHTLKSSGRVFRVYGTLNICDCHSGAEQGHVIGTGTSLAPVFYVFYNGVFNLYGGHLQATQLVPQAGVGAVSLDGTGTPGVMNMYGGSMSGGRTATSAGGILSLYNGGDFNMYGGEIYGGQSTTFGGAICAYAGSTVNLMGGKIYDCIAQGDGGNIYSIGTTAGSELHIGGGMEISGGISFGKGGNIYVAVPDFTMDGAVVSGGKATDGGGNIYLSSDDAVTAAITDSVISGGQSGSDGGNIYMANRGTLTMENTKLSGGVAHNNGGNLYLFRDMEMANTTQVKPTVTITGGSVTGGSAYDLGGGIYVMEGDLTLGGAIVIQNNEASNLYLDAGQMVTLENLTEGAQIGVSMSVEGTVSANGAYTAYVTADNSAYRAQNVDGYVKLVANESTISIPELSGFSVGWYRGVITPTAPVPLDGMGNNEGRMSKWAIKTELEAGVTVLADETGIENAIVLVSVDTLFIQKELADNLAQTISDATGIRANRIFLSASHSHCGVDHDAVYSGTREYLEWFYPTMTSYVVKAVEDLAPASIETASVEVVNENGEAMNAVRRYVDADGNAYSSVDGNVPAGADRESVADHEMQIIRFVREGDKSDVILCNWQAHAGYYGSKTLGYVSAELWLPFRQSVESQLDNTVCTSFLGACGNVGTKKTASYVGADGETYATNTFDGFGAALASFLVTTLNDASKVTQVDAGTLKVANFVFETEELYKSKYSAYSAIDMDLNVVSIGKVAFITAPYEMFHENGTQIKQYAEALGYEMCFILTNSNGENKYIASDLAFTNDETDGKLTSFEVRTCRFIHGTAERLVAQYQSMLSDLYG